mgnify:CR=1 FL=1
MIVAGPKQVHYAIMCLCLQSMHLALSSEVSPY